MALSASDLQAIYSLLANSMSLDESVRKTAEAALAQFESKPGFCSCLMEVITAKDLASQVDVRLMASVYFKNSINRYWRNRHNTGISSEEKVHLRQKLLSYLREENNQVAQMLAVLISKIARFDYPKDWPQLFSVLAQQLQSADVLTSHRIFMILFRTLKELSTKRLTADQRNFAEISSHLFDYSWGLWQRDAQTILHGFATLSQSYNSDAWEQHHEELYLICDRWLLCLKIIRQLIISGFPSDAKCVQEIQPVKEVSPALLNAIQSFLPYYSSFHNRQSKFWHFIKRACTKLMKVLVAIQGRHPYSFGDKCVLPPVMDFCLNKIADPDPDLFSFEEFLIQCMVMVKCVLECKEYKPRLTGRVIDENGVTLEQRKKKISRVVDGAVTTLLPRERIVLLCNILIRRYFVLAASDLEELYQNPESFHHEQDMVQWTEKLRPCAEALYIVLFENHSQLLGPVVVSILQEAMNGCSSSVTDITPGLLLKDAAYSAAAYVYYELSNYLNFKDWFNGALSLELSNDHFNMHIIHRKVALILGQWVSEIKDDIKRPVYCALIRLLQDKDLSVRLAACRSLCLHIEDANFSEQEFSDLLPICWDSCFKLVEEVQEFDSKVQVLNLISVLIGHVDEVIPFGNKLVEFFHKVWEESSGESLLQIQLLIALRNFVVALDYQSSSCYNMLLPILQRGIDVNSPDEINLLEDSMLLWEATLSHAPAMVPQLLAFFPCLLEIMERSFDHLEVAVNILEDYIILGGTEFLSVHASSVAKLLDMIVGNVKDKGVLQTLPVIDLLIQCFPVEVPPLISRTLQKLVVICFNRGDDRDPFVTSVKASSAAILARVLVMNTDYLAQLTSEPSLSLLLRNVGIPIEENILLCLVDIWLDQVDNASSIQRKTFGFALSIILTLRLPQVLDKLDHILSVCTSVILGGNDDLAEEESSADNMSSSRSHTEGAVPSKEFRRRQIKYADPINRVSLENSVRENLQTCAALHGESFNSTIGRMHPAAFSQLKQALKMP
ncbi:IBN_N domain-containing protein [Cephalotus follicularis]|uniref:IBN_N domain-containing protein n=1 Tax=Cephalotus follicularis TaxID=3775 RepID=A0A1Q3C024_CEPFO|nr:IBN_N domain-containing protein [Cephalotus follicularis]